MKEYDVDSEQELARHTAFSVKTTHVEVARRAIISQFFVLVREIKTCKQCGQLSSLFCWSSLSLSLSLLLLSFLSLSL